jgi:hypothetical protein
VPHRIWTLVAFRAGRSPQRQACPLCAIERTPASSVSGDGAVKRHKICEQGMTNAKSPSGATAARDVCQVVDTGSQGL